MKYIVGMLLALYASIILSSEWNCRNYDLEISCDEEKCVVSESGGFTPLDAYFNDNGSISVGMYSGVWEGKAKILTEDSYIFVVGSDLVFSTSPDTKGDILIALDKRDKVALFKGFGYAMPMRCELRETLE
ncbi:hypothetical protein Thimo_2067 [Thioflavicoccus mobilis 8321]|uniref:Uncharacterized protein n=1 Tax=Thioflavicoccus mobilis 8321 TaxID=765912 RepID=L0GZL3_9GAMM|nr:hypothetical protein [Thioflavicoccus mobilis]AGA90820.1 hypothetical protein Thimo_2067 [Thioflavicoccus mobilis 8321]